MLASTVRTGHLRAAILQHETAARRASHLVGPFRHLTRSLLQLPSTHRHRRKRHERRHQARPPVRVSEIPQHALGLCSQLCISGFSGHHYSSTIVIVWCLLTSLSCSDTLDPCASRTITASVIPQADQSLRDDLEWLADASMRARC